MNSDFQKIKELILKSKLPFSEKEELILLFSRINQEQLTPLLELIRKDESWIHKIHDNYKAKRAATAVGSSDLWQKIIRQEEAQLQELEKQK
jgi:hypothetical protein